MVKMVSIMPPPPAIFLTGSSGFVGSAVLAELRARGWQVHALTHRRSPEADADPLVWSFAGGLFDPATVDAAMQGCSAAIHLVGIIAERPADGVTFERIHVEGTRRVIESAQRQNVRRVIHMSALGARPDAVSDYHRTKWQAEELVRNSGLDWTIIRPSMIHGPGGEFMEMEAGWAHGRRAPFLFMPYFGKGALGTGGSGRIQPVFVGDVARAFVEAIENTKTIGQTYDLGGPDGMDWATMHAIVSRVLRGRSRMSLGIPTWYARLLTRIVPASLLPFNRDQVIMSQEDNTCDLQRFIQDFGWTPRGFEATLRQYAPQLSRSA